MAYTGLSVLRQQTKPGDIIQGHITDGGSAPNIIHAYAAGVFIVRAQTKARLSELKTKVEACFRAGAEATGSTLKITDEGSYDDHTPNHALARSYRHFRNRLGGDIPPPNVDIVEGRSGASTDQGNISYAYPSLHSAFQIISDIGPHNPGFTVSARTKDAHKRALTTGKALAATAVEVLTRKGYLEEIKAEFDKLPKS
jgi:metal-dependent amidase/aminoacylase/carboxypeptidase family protein